MINNQNNQFEEQVEDLKKKTGIPDEMVIGCFLHNYKDRKICSRFTNSGCRSLEMCNRLEKCLMQQN